MKQFFKQLCLFGGILLLMAVVLDLTISAGLRKTERGHFHTMNALMNDSINADVIMLGSSRVAYGYNPHIIDSVLGCNSRNLGVSGQPFGVSCLRWQLYNRHNIPPKLAIINCDFLELGGMVSNGYEREQYYPYMFDELVQPYLAPYGFNWMDKYLPMYRYHGDYKLMCIGLCEFLHIYHDHKGNPYKGYTPAYAHWQGEALESMIKSNGLQGKLDRQVVELMDSLIVDSKQKNTQIVFVNAPYYCRLRDNLDDSLSRHVYDSLATIYDIPYLDYTQMKICEDTMYFGDGCHYNYIGASIFTLQLARDLLVLNILSH